MYPFEWLRSPIVLDSNLGQKSQVIELGQGQDEQVRQIPLSEDQQGRGVAASGLLLVPCYEDGDKKGTVLQLPMKLPCILGNKRNRVT
jgi:hypothetical protein